MRIVSLVSKRTSHLTLRQLRLELADNPVYEYAVGLPDAGIGDDTPKMSTTAFMSAANAYGIRMVDRNYQSAQMYHLPSM
jgi:hypothetical protein